MANFGGLGPSGFGKLSSENFEPQRAYNFTVNFSNFIDEARFSLESMTLPTKMVSEIELNFINTRRYVAGRASFESIPLIVRDTVSGNVADELNQWHNQVFNPADGSIGNASDYKKDGEIILFGPDGNLERKWILQGSFPTAINFGSLSYDSDDIVRIEMQLRYDLVIATWATSSI